jgi:hypothetical protein
LIRKLAQRKVEVLARGRVVRFAEDDVISAIELHRLHRISFWDAMIVHSARLAGADVLYSEDLQHGAVLAGVRPGKLRASNSKTCGSDSRTTDSEPSNARPTLTKPWPRHPSSRTSSEANDIPWKRLKTSLTVDGRSTGISPRRPNTRYRRGWESAANPIVLAPSLFNSIAIDLRAWLKRRPSRRIVRSRPLRNTLMHFSISPKEAKNTVPLPSKSPRVARYASPAAESIAHRWSRTILGMITCNILYPTARS